MIRLGIAAVVVLAVVFAITNPGQDVHRKAVLASVATQKTNSETLGKIAVDLLGDREILPLTYNNYYVFSTTTMNGKTSSVGVLSRVWNLK